MARHRNGNAGALREHIAREAARILVESGSRNFLQAKRKAAQRLGVEGERGLPGNDEVERALYEYQRLFHPDRHDADLRRLRETGLQAMRLLERFSPRLVGAVLEGTADRYSEVNLHLFADAVEEVGLFLMDQGIPAELMDRRLRDARGRQVQQPEYRFMAGDVPVGLTVFVGPGERQSPLSPVDGRPMRRASLAQVSALLGEARP